MTGVIEFPARPRTRGANEAYELLVNWLIEAMGDIAELRARVEELEAERGLPGPRPATLSPGGQKDKAHGEI